MFLVAGCWLLVTACNQPNKDNKTKVKKGLIINNLTKKPYPIKIISLVPSLTEIIFAIGGGKRVIACSNACNFPAEVSGKIRINTFPIPDYDKIYSLKPDLVLVSEEIFTPDVGNRLKDLNIKIINQNYNTIADILEGIKLIGMLSGNEIKANQIIDSLKILITQFKSMNYSDKPRVLVLVSINPLISCGGKSFINDKIKLAGGINVLEKNLENPYPLVKREEVLSLNPDIIIGEEKQEIESNFLHFFPELMKTNAFKNKKIMLVDPDKFYRPSPRCLESVAELKNYFHGNK